MPESADQAVTPAWKRGAFRKAHMLGHARQSFRRDDLVGRQPAVERRRELRRPIAKRAAEPLRIKRIHNLIADRKALNAFADFEDLSGRVGQRDQARPGGNWVASPHDG